MATGIGCWKCKCSIRWPIPEKLPIGAKISQLSDVIVSDITFLWFLLFSMSHLLHFAVNNCINWCFVHLYLLFYYKCTVFILVINYKNNALQILFYSSQANYNCYRVIANFVPNFVAMATYVNRAKMQLAAFDGSSSKIPIYAQKSRKNLSLKQSYSQFCPKFRCQCNWQHSIAHAVFDVSLIACRR